LLEKGGLSGAAEDLKMSTLCVDYMNLPIFQEPVVREALSNGSYGFMDYAVLYWVRHLEARAADVENHTALIKDLSESLGAFLENHWNSPTARLPATKRTRALLQRFGSMAGKMDQLEQAVSSARKQLNFYGQVQKSETALTLPDIVRSVRKTLEEYASESELAAGELAAKYGTNLFKCPRFSCQFFTAGFLTAAERDKHINKHERPFRCTFESCDNHVLAFTSKAEQQTHIKEAHHASEIQDEEFPSNEDIEESLKLPEPSVPVPQAQPDELEAQSSSSDSEPEPAAPAVAAAIPQMVKPPKRVRVTEWKCTTCSLVFKKKYNYSSHMHIHTGDKPNKCSKCDYSSARMSDYRRHLLTHSSERGHVCRGFLKSGEQWGCGRSFSRADILSQHYRSNVGRECVRRILLERDAQRLPFSE
jgi:hypothetical protein